MTRCVTLLESGQDGRFHLVLRRGVDNQGRMALLVLRGPGHHSRMQAEASRALVEAELASNDWNYSDYDCQVVIVQPDEPRGASPEFGATVGP